MIGHILFLGNQDDVWGYTVEVFQFILRNPLGSLIWMALVYEPVCTRLYLVSSAFLGLKRLSSGT